MRRPYENGAIPDGWRQVRLGDICSPPEYGASAPARAYNLGLSRYVRITDITDDGRLRADDPRSADPDQVKGYELDPGDLLFARSGATVGKTYMYRAEDGPCVFAGYLIRFRPKPKRVYPNFLKWCTRSSFYQTWVASMLRAGAQPNINANEYSSFSVILPPLPEQRAIAAVLDSIDDAIEGAEAVIAATEGLRDALLHDLLTRGLPGQHTEFRDVPGLGTIPADWEVVRLGDVCAPPQYGASAPAQPYNPELPRYVRITDLTDDGRLKQEDGRSAEPSRVSGYELESGDLLFARSGATVGKTYMYREKDGPCVYAGYLIRFRPHRNLTFPEYLERCTHSQFYSRWVESMLRAGAQPNINAAEYSSLTIPLPPLVEQQAIAAALDGVDATLKVAREELAGLRLLKESTADALLTGRVRIGGKNE